MKSILIKGAREHNLKDVTLELPRDKLIVITGVSGSGKSTTGRALMQMPPPTSGTVTFDGRVLSDLKLMTATVTPALPRALFVHLKEV